MLTGKACSVRHHGQVLAWHGHILNECEMGSFWSHQHQLKPCILICVRRDLVFMVILRT